jgi:hypothetical protein
LAGLGFGGLSWIAPVAALGAGAVMAATVVLAHGWRWFLLKLTLVAALIGGLATATAFAGWIYVALALALLIAIPSQPVWLDRIKLPWIQSAMASAEIERSIDAVWQVVRPVPGAAFWDPSVEAIELGHGNDGLRLKHRRPDGSTFIQDLQLLDVAPLRTLKVRDRSLPEADAGGPVAVTAFTFAGDREHCRLLLVEGEWNRPLWKSISLWLDDYLADYVDHMAALIDRRPDPSLRGAILRSLAGD